jgi:hypothetical protein
VKSLFLLALTCLCLSAQTVTFAIHDNSGTNPDMPLPAAYQFPSTPQGSSSSIMLKATNNSSRTIQVVLAYVGGAPGSSVSNLNYSITNIAVYQILAPSASQYFTVNFTPSRTGQLLGYLQVTYLVQQNGCVFAGASSGTPCSGFTDAVSTLEGTGTSPQFLLTYDKGQGQTSLQPNAESRLDFGSVSTSSSSSIAFTLTNETSQPIATPAVSLNSAVFFSSAFSLDTSALPAILPASGAGTFRITFSPGQTETITAVLKVGTNSYGIQGTGVALTDIDALQIYYVDSKDVRSLPQAATPISFGQLVPGTTGGNVLKFTVTNPATSFNAVTISTLSTSGAAYSLSGAPALPATIQPNASITFIVTFNASTSGTFTGSLTIGTRVFSLTGLAVVSQVPSISMQVSASPLTSAQQVDLTIQASTAATQDAIGELEMAFTPSVAEVNDDPAIAFLATSSRKMQVTLTKGTQSATYDGQSALTFQTGTTAGTITFTLTFTNTPPIVQSFTVSPALIRISSGLAVRQNPALMITVNGYDNTYTAGKMSFTFFDLKGSPITSKALPVDASSAFHNYFFVNDPAGGAFAMQANFPVTGDVTQIGSVAVTMTNSMGQTSTNLTFQ